MYHRHSNTENSNKRQNKQTTNISVDESWRITSVAPEAMEGHEVLVHKSFKGPYRPHSSS